MSFKIKDSVQVGTVTVLNSSGELTTPKVKDAGSAFNVALLPSTLAANITLTIPATSGTIKLTTDAETSTLQNVTTRGNTTANIISITNTTVSTTTATGALLVSGGVGVAGNLYAAAANITGTANVANLVSTGNITAAGNIGTGNMTASGNVSASYFLGNGSQLTGLNAAGIANGTSNINIPAINGNVNISSAGNANIAIITGIGANITGTLGVTGDASLPSIISTSTNSNVTVAPNGTGLFVVAGAKGGATGVELGTPTLGALTSNALTLTSSSTVSNSIAQLNAILGKLVPPSPAAFPNAVNITIASFNTSVRMTNFVQTDNTTGANKSVAAGTTVSTSRRAATYTTNTISDKGPGDSGLVSCMLNSVTAGSVTLTGASNGTYGNLVITLNRDYNAANALIAAGFWSVFSASLSGTVAQGWNEVFISDSAAASTNTANWYYDASAPGTPVFSTVTFTAPGAPVYEYSSTVPHYTNTNAFAAGFLVNRLSGDTYPLSDTFVTGTSGGAFSAPTSVTYATAGVTTPLARNLYVASGNATVATTATVISGFGSSSANCTVSALNGYNTGTANLNPGATVLYKTGTGSTMEEANVVIGSTIGSGTGLAFRILNPGSTNTPVYTGAEAAFNSQSGTLQVYDATVVASVLKHDQINYSTGYLPVGPNLSTGRTGTQYLTFKFIRTAVSKFDIRYTGNIAGCWVSLPGSVIDTSSTANGWMDMTVAYAGAGYPGVTGPGNGSNGCALGGIIAVNTAQSVYSRTCTFGTVSSSSTSTNEIYVRIALTAGQTVTALSLQTASN